MPQQLVLEVKEADFSGFRFAEPGDYDSFLGDKLYVGQGPAEVKTLSFKPAVIFNFINTLKDLGTHQVMAITKIQPEERGILDYFSGRDRTLWRTDENSGINYLICDDYVLLSKKSSDSDLYHLQVFDSKGKLYYQARILHCDVVDGAPVKLSGKDLEIYYQMTRKALDEKGGKIFYHCQAGIGRSGSACLAAFRFAQRVPRYASLIPKDCPSGDNWPEFLGWIYKKRSLLAHRETPKSPLSRVNLAQLKDTAETTLSLVALDEAKPVLKPLSLQVEIAEEESQKVLTKVIPPKHKKSKGFAPYIIAATTVVGFLIGLASGAILIGLGVGFALGIGASCIESCCWSEPPAVARGPSDHSSRQVLTLPMPSRTIRPLSRSRKKRSASLSVPGSNGVFHGILPSAELTQGKQRCPVTIQR